MVVVPGSHVSVFWGCDYTGMKYSLLVPLLGGVAGYCTTRISFKEMIQRTGKCQYVSWWI